MNGMFVFCNPCARAESNQRTRKLCSATLGSEKPLREEFNKLLYCIVLYYIVERYEQKIL